MTNTKARGAYFITGPAGAGKTTTVAELRHQGFHAIDGDIGHGALGEDGLGGFFDRDGRQAHHIHPESEDWKQHHTWLMIGSSLKRVITQHADDHIFIGMAAHNQYDYLNLFDQVFFLDIPEDALVQRLQAERDHGYGKEAFQRRRILEDLPLFRQRMLQEKATFINPLQTPAEVVAEILSHINS